MNELDQPINESIDIKFYKQDNKITARQDISKIMSSLREWVEDRKIEGVRIYLDKNGYFLSEF